MSPTNRCDHCPLDAAMICAGEAARRVCELVADPVRGPGYRVSIERAARPRADRSPEDLEGDLAAMEAARLCWEAMTPAERASCCGGGP